MLDSSSLPSHGSLALPAALLALGLAACSSSDDGPAGPDVTAPVASSFVQDRTTDPTGSTVNVNFNEAVTAATAEIIANYTVSGGINVTAANLGPTGRGVALTLDAPAIPGDNTIEVAAGIEDAAGNASEAVTATAITSTDTTAPGAASVEGETVSGPENDMIIVTFNDDMVASEVEVVANWTIESPLGTNWDATGATVSYDAMTREATMTLGAASADQNLQTFDDIHVSFIGMRDIGGNTIAATAIGTSAVSGMVMGDTEPPVLMSVVPGSGTDATLTFSENVINMETSDLSATGTSIVLTDANDPGMAAAGTLALSGVVADGDTISISDGTTAVVFEFDFGATGSISLSGQPADTDEVTIGDGITSVSFEFDNDASATGTPVTIGADANATGANLLAAINASALTVTATMGATDADVNLRNDATGAAGNVSITNTDTATVQTIVGMAGGGVTGANEVVAVDTTSEAVTMTNLRAAIDANAFNITTAAGANPESAALANDAVGTAGNVDITVVQAGSAIAATGMAGGTEMGTLTLEATASTSLTDDLQATVTFASAPEAADTLRLVGATDLAGNQMFSVLAAPVIAADATIPSLDAASLGVETLSGENNDSITVVYDVPMHPESVVDPANYTITGAAAIDLTGATFTFDDVDEVTITFGPESGVNLLTADAHTIEVNNVSSLQGVARTAANTEAGITPTGDTTAPSIGVSDARLDPNVANSVIVTFDEAVSETGGIDIANYTIAGNTTTAAEFDTPRTVRVTFQDEPALADNMDIAVAAATDLAGNAVVGVATVSIAAADATVPTLDTVTAMANGASGPDMIQLAFSEPLTTSVAETIGNYSITSNSAPVDLTDARIEASSADDSVRIYLAEGIRLQTGDAVSVTTANLTDAAGNLVAAAPVNGTVAGDAVAPAAAVSFVNLSQSVTGTTVDVQFDEPMDMTTTMTAGNWSGSNSQTATEVTMLNESTYRVTFSAPIAAADTIDVLTPTDAAGNEGATITLDPVE